MEINDYARYRWIIGCDVNMEPTEKGNSTWFQKLAVVFAATEDEARAEPTLPEALLQGILSSRDLVDLVSMRTIIDDIPSAAHKSLRLVRRARRETNMLV